MKTDPTQYPATRLTTDFGAPVASNRDSLTAGARGPLLAQDVWLNEKLAGFVREVIPERRMHAKGSGAFGTFTVTHDITRYTRARLFGAIGKKTEMFARFTTVAGERGAADAERDIRGFALKFYTEEGNWDMVGNNTPVFFIRDPRQFPDLNKAVKRDPRSNLRSATYNWDYWTLIPEALHQITIVMSDRGIPASYRHMHGFGSHTYSFWNANGERFWCKLHFKTQQGIRNRSDAEATELIGRDREGPPAPLRPDQGLVPGRLPADRGRRVRAEPEPRELLPRRRAERLFAQQPGARHRRLARQDAAGAAVQLRRGPALPAGREPPADPGQPRALPGAQQPPRRQRPGRCQLRRHAALRTQQLRPVAGAARVRRAAAGAARRRRFLERARRRRQLLRAAAPAVPVDERRAEADPLQQQDRKSVV